MHKPSERDSHFFDDFEDASDVLPSELITLTTTIDEPNGPRFEMQPNLQLSEHQIPISLSSENTENNGFRPNDKNYINNVNSCSGTINNVCSDAHCADDDDDDIIMGLNHTASSSQQIFPPNGDFETGVATAEAAVANLQAVLRPVEPAWQILGRKYVSIAIFAYFGVLARVLLSMGAKASEELSNLGPGFLLPNIVGCAVMGFMGKAAGLWPSLKSYPVLIVGITTGFCGCCTTFATWKAQVIKTLAQEQIQSACVHMVVTYATSQVSFLFGGHLAIAIEYAHTRIANYLAQSGSQPGPPGAPSGSSDNDSSPHARANGTSKSIEAGYTLAASNSAPCPTHQNGPASTYPGPPSVRLTDRLPSQVWSVLSHQKRLLTVAIPVATLVAITVSLWLLAALDTRYVSCDPPRSTPCENTSRRKVWVAACFGPFGAWLRFVLSLRNSTVPNFPLYTWIANVVASVANVILYIGADHLAPEGVEAESVSYAAYSLWILSGISTGFMGSLSTVSTWINEMNKLSDRSIWFSYRYGVGTLIAADLLCWAIVGIWMGLGFSF